MSREAVVAVDAGTGSCRAVVFDAGGRRIGLAQEEWTHLPEPGVPGSQVFDTRTNWGLAVACVRRAVDAAGVGSDGVAAITATSMREGIVLWDGEGEELWACPNVDARAGEEATELVASGAAEEIYARAGDWVAITSPARLLWLRRHRPGLLEGATAVGMLSDWLVARLCGRHLTDPTAGSSSGLFDLAARTWSPELLALLELDPAIFPDVVAPGTPAGTLTPAAAGALGLDPDTVVCVGGADTQLGLMGIGQLEPGSFTAVGGSFWQHAAIVPEALIDPDGRLRTLCHAFEGQWMLEGIGFWSGFVLRWFRDAFCPDLGSFSALEAPAAEIPPGAHGVFGLFSNVMNARRWTHAAPGFLGFDIADPARSGRRECVRAIQEAGAYVAHAHQAIIEEVTGTRFGSVVLTGGAARSAVWPQILADVTGLPVRVPEMEESTALGAAVLAGEAVGLYRSAAGILADAVSFRAPVEPDPARHAAYRELEARWAAVYERSLAMAEEGLLVPMWRAAGA